jgi:hypothetical protein
LVLNKLPIFFLETELFDFTTQTWSDGPVVTPPDLIAQYVANAAPLDDNRVLVYGGCPWGGGPGSSSTYMYDFITGLWSTMSSMIVPTCDNGGGLVWSPGNMNAGTEF